MCVSVSGRKESDHDDERLAHSGRLQLISPMFSWFFLRSCFRLAISFAAISKARHGTSVSVFTLAFFSSVLPVRSLMHI